MASPVLDQPAFSSFELQHHQSESIACPTLRGELGDPPLFSTYNQVQRGHFQNVHKTGRLVIIHDISALVRERATHAHYPPLRLKFRGFTCSTPRMQLPKTSEGTPSLLRHEGRSRSVDFCPPCGGLAWLIGIGTKLTQIIHFQCKQMAQRGRSGASANECMCQEGTAWRYAWRIIMTAVLPHCIP